MSERVYQQVEDAIHRKLHVLRGVDGTFNSWLFAYPVGIELGDIIMRDSDCGLAKEPMIWTPAEWSERVGIIDGSGLYRQVGFWDFVPANEPAADCIRYCHSAPSSAGRELYRLRREVEALEARLHGEIA